MNTLEENALYWQAERLQRVNYGVGEIKEIMEHLSKHTLPASEVKRFAQRALGYVIGIREALPEIVSEMKKTDPGPFVDPN